MNQRKGQRRRTRLAAALSVAAVLLLGLSACAGPLAEKAGIQPTAKTTEVAPLTTDTVTEKTHTPSVDLTADWRRMAVADQPADETFLNGAAAFAVGLLQQSVAAGDNVLLSPFSALLALSMTANGAAGETRTQMEHVLAGGMSIDRLNAYLHTYMNGLPSDEKARLQTANAIWIRDGENRFEAKPLFLQTNVNYYGAAVNKAPFDEQTVGEINRWAAEQTGGRIDQLLTALAPTDRLLLLNAVTFDAAWTHPYEEHQVSDGNFHTSAGAVRQVKMMRATEQRYLDDGRATGFLKEYAGGRYQFVALLPNEGVSLRTYADSLTGEGFRQLLAKAEEAPVSTALPQFQFACDAALTDALQALGMTDAFGPGADFSRLGTGTDGPLAIGSVLQKTYIQVFEQGTRAGAVTSVMIAGSTKPEKTYAVTLDRPFLYGIVDGETGLPLFLGAMTDPAIENSKMPTG